MNETTLSNENLDDDDDFDTTEYDITDLNSNVDEKSASKSDLTSLPHHAPAWHLIEYCLLLINRQAYVFPHYAQKESDTVNVEAFRSALRSAPRGARYFRGLYYGEWAHYYHLWYADKVSSVIHGEEARNSWSANRFEFPAPALPEDRAVIFLVSSHPRHRSIRQKLIPLLQSALVTGDYLRFAGICDVVTSALEPLPYAGLTVRFNFAHAAPGESDVLLVNGDHYGDPQLRNEFNVMKTARLLGGAGLVAAVTAAVSSTPLIYIGSSRRVADFVDLVRVLAHPFSLICPVFFLPTSFDLLGYTDAFIAVYDQALPDVVTQVKNQAGPNAVVIYHKSDGGAPVVVAPGAEENPSFRALHFSMIDAAANADSLLNSNDGYNNVDSLCALIASYSLSFLDGLHAHLPLGVVDKAGFEASLRGDSLKQNWSLLSDCAPVSMLLGASMSVDDVRCDSLAPYSSGPLTVSLLAESGAFSSSLSRSSPWRARADAYKGILFTSVAQRSQFDDLSIDLSADDLASETPLMATASSRLSEQLRGASAGAPGAKLALAQLHYERGETADLLRVLSDLASTDTEQMPPGAALLLRVLWREASGATEAMFLAPGQSDAGSVNEFPLSYQIVRLAHQHRRGGGRGIRPGEEVGCFRGRESELNAMLDLYERGGAGKRQPSIDVVRHIDSLMQRTNLVKQSSLLSRAEFVHEFDSQMSTFLALGSGFSAVEGFIGGDLLIELSDSSLGSSEEAAKSSAVVSACGALFRTKVKSLMADFVGVRPGVGRLFGASGLLRHRVDRVGMLNADGLSMGEIVKAGFDLAEKVKALSIGFSLPHSDSSSSKMKSHTTAFLDAVAKHLLLRQNAANRSRYTCRLAVVFAGNEQQARVCIQSLFDMKGLKTLPFDLQPNLFLLPKSDRYSNDVEEIVMHGASGLSERPLLAELGKAAPRPLTLSRARASFQFGLLNALEQSIPGHRLFYLSLSAKFRSSLHDERVLGSGSFGSVSAFAVGQGRQRPLVARKRVCGSAYESGIVDLAVHALVAGRPHPNMVYYIGAVCSPSDSCVDIFMPLYEPFQNYLPKYASGEWDALEAAADIAAGLDHMINRLGMTWRDGCPANLLLSHAQPGRRRRVLLNDYGVARPMDESVEQETMVGHRIYFGPELLPFPCAPKCVAGRGDVHSFGWCIWAMLSKESLKQRLQRDRAFYLSLGPCIVYPGVPLPQSESERVRDVSKLMPVNSTLSASGDVTRFRYLLSLFEQCIAWDPVSRPEIGAIARRLRRFHVSGSPEDAKPRPYPRVRIIVGSLFDAQVDAIIHPCRLAWINDEPNDQSWASRELCRLAGPDILRELRLRLGLARMHASAFGAKSWRIFDEDHPLITGGYDLASRFVIHMMGGVPHEKNVPLLQQSYRAVLNLALSDANVRHLGVRFVMMNRKGWSHKAVASSWFKAIDLCLRGREHEMDVIDIYVPARDLEKEKTKIVREFKAAADECLPGVVQFPADWSAEQSKSKKK